MHQRKLLFIVLACFLAGCDPARPLSSKERAVFPTALACPNSDGQGYRVMLKGLYFRESWVLRHQTLVEDWLDIEELIPDESKRMILRERTHLLLAHRPEGRYLRIHAGDRVECIGPSSDHGVLSQDILLSQTEADVLRSSPAGLITFHMEVASNNPQSTAIHVFPVSSEGLSIISDIDDTMRITEVNNTKRMLANLLMNEVRVVEGMPDLYRAWAGTHGAQFHYLSASVYQIFPSLRPFLSEHYPPGSVHMRAATEHGVKVVLSMFSTPKDYKTNTISELMEAMPRRRFVLVGDSGERDPEIYAEVARKYPGRVIQILIRNVTCEEAESERYQATFSGLPRTLWRIFKNPAEIRDAITQ